MAKSAGVLAKPEDGGAYKVYDITDIYVECSKSRAIGGEGAPILSAATWRLPELTSSHRLVY